MPYITEQRRGDLEGHVGHVKDDMQNPGELQYMIALLINQYLTTWNLDYQTINDIVGALEGAKLEFYRRVAVPYEEDKRYLNGDVY